MSVQDHDEGFANSPAYDVWRTECALAAAIAELQAHAKRAETRGHINRANIYCAALALVASIEGDRHAT